MSEDAKTESATRFFRLFGENAAAITLACTAFSLIVNFFRFQYWGLDYAAVITPSDVIVAGIEAFALFFPIFVAALMGVWAGHRTKKIFSSNRTRTIIGALMGFPMLVWIGLFAYYFDGSTKYGGIWFLSYLLVLTFWVETLVISGDKFFLKADSELAIWANIGLVWSIFLSMFIVFALDDMGPTADISLTKSDRCKGKEFVVWIGAENVVTTCQNGKVPLERDYYIVERDGLAFSVTD